MKTIAEAIRASLISPNVTDSNFEAANVVDAIDNLARAVRFAAEQQRATADATAEGLGKIASAIREMNHE